VRHSIVRFEESKLTVPAGYGRHAKGYGRASMVDHETAGASVHMGHGIAQLAPTGSLDQHVNAFEKSIYILEGSLDFELDGRAYKLVRGDYALVSVGATNTYRGNGGDGARWLEMISPQPLAKSVGGDTFFVGSFDWPAKVVPFDTSDVRQRFVAHFDDSQLPAAANLQMDGYSGDGAAGIRLKMLTDRNFGAHHMTMFMVEFQKGGGGTHHTHPFEESYFLLAGQADCELEGEKAVISAGDCVWTGVGAKHTFFQKGDAPVRWIETQSPQPPARQAFRFDSEWKAMREKFPD
jgi:quercetin dioxygenase-like cupin family protein